MPEPSSRVHPLAVVEDGAEVGAETSIWHHAHVRAGARIGTASTIGKNVFVDAGAVVGDRVKIQNNVSVYVGVTIGDDVFVGPSAVFTNDRVPRAFNLDWTITPTRIDDGASIGANATIVCGVTLGTYSMIAAGSVVTRDVAPHQLVAGNPARHLGWVCRCGEVISREAERPSTMACARCADTQEENPS